MIFPPVIIRPWGMFRYSFLSLCMNILSITVLPLYAESIQQLADLEPFISSIITYQFKITNFTFVKIKNCDLKIKGFI